MVDHTGRARIRSDGDRSSQGELAGKYTEPAQHGALGIWEQLIAPVERGAERLVAGQSGAPASRQKPEPVIQVRRQIPHTKDADACRRQLERQRNTVEPATNLQDRRHVGLAHNELIHRRGGAFVEQLYSRVAQCLGGEVNRIRWKFERCQAMQRFTLCSQGLAAGSQNTNARPGLEQRLGERRRRADDVLAAVQHQQGGLVAQPRGQRPHVVAARRMDPQRSAKDTWDELGIGQGGQSDKPGAVLI